MRTDIVWQNPALVESFLTGVRGGIPFAAEQIQIALQILDHNALPVRRVADLGCGDGAIAQAVLARYPDAQVVAIDFSEPMLSQAKQRLQSVSNRVEFQLADLYDSNWHIGQAPFDAIVSGYCIHHLPDQRKQTLFHEIYRSLTPGGFFLNIEHVASASPWLETLFNEALIDSLYQWHQAQNSPLSRQEVAQTFVHREDKDANILAPVELQCQWLREIGFQQVDCFFKFFELAVFGGRKI